MKLSLPLLLTTTLSLSMSASAQDRFKDVTIKDTPMGGAVHMLEGAGGNIGVSAGEDGILIIDDQYEPLAEKIAEALGKLGDKKPRYIINTHFHGDHTGANSYFHNHGDSTIFAHENVRVRLAEDSEYDQKALPVVTYKEGITLHFNGETLNVWHLPAGHTDGDSVIWFKEPNVLHTGDLFFNGRFPYIDLKSGGTVEGYIEDVRMLLGKISDETAIIPGHGPKATKADYQAFLTMLNQTKAYVDDQKAAGKSVDDIISAGLDEKWSSWSWEFINEEKWIRTLYGNN